jgi:hypothetical protein
MNFLSRLTLLHINLIGLGVVALLSLILFLALIKPGNEDIQRVQADTRSQEDAGGTPDKVTGNKRLLAQTKQNAATTDAQWQVFASKYMPDIDFGTQDTLLSTYMTGAYRSGGQVYGIRDLPIVWGRWITAWFDVQRNLGVARIPGVEFPLAPFPADPNYTSTLTSLAFPQAQPWPVTVEAKGFNQAMAHLRRFNGMEKHGMPVVDNVALSGQSPNLLMSYNLRLYIIPSKTPPLPDQRIGGTPAPAAGMGMTGGYRGMMGGGVSGMPMGAMPGGPPAGMGGSMGGGKAPGGALNPRNRGGAGIEGE